MIHNFSYLESVAAIKLTEKALSLKIFDESFKV